MADPSPITQIKVGAAAYVTAVGGVTMTSGSTIIIALANTSGVNSWTIECLTTDETSVAATVTASLSIDQVAKTATFTAPSTAGKTYRFRSVVNGGVDANGVYRPSYTFTFCLYRLSATSKRVLAADETFEGDATYGWITIVNAALR